MLRRMLFSWFKTRRRRRLASAPLPEAWRSILHDNVPQFAALSSEERQKFLADLKIFVAEKNWEGCGGLVLTEEMKVTIAAFACLMTLGLGVAALDHLLSILVYPAAFVVPERTPIGNVELEGARAIEGQAVHRGPVILSWQEVLADAHEPGSGSNLVWHEVAHQLDLIQRPVDAIPRHKRRATLERWKRVLTAEHRRLVAATRRGMPTLLDDYGAQDLTEFFAVASETFFDLPHELRRQHGELYGVLADFYRQDPAARDEIVSEYE